MNVLDFAALGMRVAGDTDGLAADDDAAAATCWLAGLHACVLTCVLTGL
jgi:hypothetical protein